MKIPVLLAASALVLSACATTPTLTDAQQLEIYQANAGEPVKSFRNVLTLHSFQPLGDSALVVWTRPSEGYLLTLAGSCPNLDYAMAISFTGQTGMVSAGFDDVLVMGQSTQIPCKIRQIQPLDGEGVRQAEEEAEAALQSSGT